MSEIKPIPNDYVTVKGFYGVINQGTNYAIVNIHTGETLAHNISSFLDCVKTIDYLLESVQPPPPPEQKIKNFDVKPDVQRLIEKYAPETVRVDKSVNFLSQSSYKCYDALGNVLGRVRGSTSNRYWQYGGLDSEKCT
ncbi:hypothetical protein PN488_20045 [Nodularia spumigena CS-591/12]|uniref:Uncharacterized protein n=1 Tax=Nodularia spumigena CENA596 TaxID=1819295 RepID=A0A166K834_NODSP|nr:hypothetical protein [Nodularia spumigena]KZL50709.1 hypothetical protein A2T98_06035 [Nodularia spumigena CENA596]MDB9306627.1 hypothetical protein [Nodularia spumigena CS-591/12]